MVGLAAIAARISNCRFRLIGRSSALIHSERLAERQKQS
jgi:hypothetical protein